VIQALDEERNMRHIVALLIICLSTCAFAEGGTEDIIVFKFTNTPLRVVLDAYASRSGKHVEIVDGVRANITAQNSEGVTRAEYFQLIETELQNANIGLFPISTNRLVATWLHPSEESARSARRLKADFVRSETNTQEYLRQRNMDLIRRGAAPLRGPMIRDTDVPRVAEGVLPKLETNRSDPSNKPNGE
jgi:hypothetical protein